MKDANESLAWATDWKKRFEWNAQQAERNSLMDSGWSAQTADACLSRACRLWQELAVRIAETETLSKDFFDRPDLVAIQDAARFATNTKPEAGESGR
jgi:hypothetical protein